MDTSEINKALKSAGQKTVSGQQDLSEVQKVTGSARKKSKQLNLTDVGKFDELEKITGPISQAKTKKAPAKKAPAKEATAKKAPAKKAPAKKAPAKKATSSQALLRSGLVRLPKPAATSARRKAKPGTYRIKGSLRAIVRRADATRR